ncbi:MAG: hypothetical protein SO253_00750 [Bacilli bacterium]|nr:hypothetical protein [Bacilli bacterium]
MGRYKNSGLAHGTIGSPQGSIEQNNYKNKVEELNEIHEISISKFNKNNLDYSLSKTKIENYILDINHPKGGSKAKFFVETLGYSKNNPKQFYDNLSDAIDNKVPKKVIKTVYGIVCEFHEKIKGINGKYVYANIIASVQKDNDKCKYRIITVYPDKKEQR